MQTHRADGGTGHANEREPCRRPGGKGDDGSVNISKHCSKHIYRRNSLLFTDTTLGTEDFTMKTAKISTLV